MAIDDYFAVFGLPRKLIVDGEALRARFYDLSRTHHPDFHQGADADVQAETLARSALVNRAYRALRDPLARVEYLVALEEGRDTREGATARPTAPRGLPAARLGGRGHPRGRAGAPPRSPGAPGRDVGGAGGARGGQGGGDGRAGARPAPGGAGAPAGGEARGGGGQCGAGRRC